MNVHSVAIIHVYHREFSMMKISSLSLASFSHVLTTQQVRQTPYFLDWRQSNRCKSALAVVIDNSPCHYRRRRKSTFGKAL